MLDQIDNFPSVSGSSGKWQMAAIYGIGSIYNINDNWGIKTELNSQRFNTRYPYYSGQNSIGQTTTNKVRLNVLKVGVIYSF